MPTDATVSNDTCTTFLSPSKDAARVVSLDALRGFDMFWIIGGSIVIQGTAKASGHPSLAWLSEQMNHVVKFWGGGTVSLLRDALDKLDQEQPLLGGHGTMWETSIVMALHEHWVDLSRVDRIQGSPISHQLKDLPPAKLQGIKSANAEFGNRFLNLAAARMTERAAQLLTP